MSNTTIRNNVLRIFFSFISVNGVKLNSFCVNEIWPRMPYRCKDSKYFGKCKRRSKELDNYMILDPLIIEVKNERMREICRRPTDRRGGNERIIFMQMNWQEFVVSDETWNCLQRCFFYFLSRIWELENYLHANELTRIRRKRRDMKLLAISSPILNNSHSCNKKILKFSNSW